MHDRIEAGDSTFARPSTTALKDRLAELQLDRAVTLMADDFAMTNGSVRKIDRQMDAIRNQLRDMEAAAKVEGRG
ncbi:MAG: hypothetical protein J0I48_15030 [Devosia sp.]|uniref:hypothetical protein n=1 Tax=Devosia sp. 66-22 TaxID=1895753 RepID=UPI00092AD25B|nr:hypothetical protein [Devosia sp. 66-22]MBN9347487.1 hypothetical protein [Devosia sp.]OJX53649.1 MAG: hypothetical protein BGO81_13880 [Devosia sp. 66-22]